MDRNIVVEKLERPSIEERGVEIVERKGIGHPDTLADGMSEAISRALCIEYRKRFDTILHHNTDKVTVVGGSARPEFGGGEVIDPIYVLLAGRGTSQVGEQTVPINEIAKEAAEGYLDEVMRFLNVEDHVEFDSRIGSGSADLKDVFRRGSGSPAANDTSVGIAYAPLSETERLVLETERILNLEETKKDFPAIGEDIKVMACRQGEKIDLTVAVATISSLIDDMGHYLSLMDEVDNLIRDLSAKVSDKFVDVHLNTADDLDEEVVYLTVTGTSAEQGDDGMTGRGNGANGLITPDRLVSREAVAGKNPKNHVGKLYNLLAEKIAHEVLGMDGVREVHVGVLSRIGQPIDRPQILNVRILPDDERKMRTLESEAKRIAGEKLSNIQEITEEVVAGKLPLY